MQAKKPPKQKKPAKVIDPKPIPLDSAFNSVKPPSMTAESGAMGNGYFEGVAKGSEVIEKVKKLEVGQGNNTVKIDEQGMWIGHQNFDQARRRFYFNGTDIYNDGTHDRIIIGEDPNPAPIS